MWVHSSLNVKQHVSMDRPEVLESIWLSIPSSKIIFACLYIPPHISSSDHKIIEVYIQTSTDMLLTRFPDFYVIISGDLNKFNVSNLQESLDLTNLVNEPTRESSYLDHFLVSSSIAQRFSVTVEAPISNSDHRSVSARPKFEIRRNISLSKTLYDFRRSNINNFLKCLSQVNWYHFYNSDLDIDEKCDIFHEIFQDLLMKCIPMTSVDISDSDKPWMNPFIKFDIQKRWGVEEISMHIITEKKKLRIPSCKRSVSGRRRRKLTLHSFGNWSNPQFLVITHRVLLSLS